MISNIIFLNLCFVIINFNYNVFSINIKQTHTDEYEIETFFENMKKGEEIVKLSPNEKNVTLILGATNGENRRYLRMLLKHNSTINSRNKNDIFPEKMEDAETNSVYFVCPSFTTRDSINEIVATYFTKKVAESVENIKFLFIVGYRGVNTNASLTNFVKFAQNSISFFKNITKFEDSISLLVTDVDSSQSDDIFIIHEIASFLNKSINIFSKELKDESISTEVRKLNFNCFQFINILLKKEINIFSNIVIIRRPVKPGAEADYTSLNMHKNPISKLNKIKKFTPIEEDEDEEENWKFSVSKKPESYRKALSARMGDMLDKSLGDLMQEMYNQIHENIQDGKEMIRKCSMASVFKDRKYQVLIQYDMHLEFFETLSRFTYIQKGFVVMIIIYFDLKNMENLMSQYFNQIDYYEFLISLKINGVKTNSWKKIFNSISQELTSLQHNFTNKVADHINNRTFFLKNVFKDLRDNIPTFVKSIDVHDVPEELERKYGPLALVVNQMILLKGSQDFSSIFYDWERNGMHSHKLRSNFYNFQYHKTQLSCLAKIKNIEHEFIFHFPLDEYDPLVNDVISTQEWYEFLNRLQTVFSFSDVQYNTKRYKVFPLENWGDRSIIQENKITKDNIKTFFRKLSRFGFRLSNFEKITEMNFDDSKLRELNEVMGLFINHPTVICSDKNGLKEITITGDNIRLSDFSDANGIINVCVSRTYISSVEIFGYNSVIFDRNINLEGSQCSFAVIAPKWHISEKININLNGKNVVCSKLKGAGYDCNALGLDGASGGPAGHFFGAFDTIENPQLLSVTSNGGRGGTGNDGRPGTPGYDGLNPQKPWEKWEKRIKRDDKVITISYSESIQKYEVFGQLGEPGSPGEDGGNGGEGGPNGNITIIDLRSTSVSQITQVAEYGTPGEGGTGGEGGAGGRNGDVCELRYYVRFLGVLPVSHYWGDTAEPCSSQGHQMNGRPGKQGNTGKERSKIFFKSQQYISVIKYKAYLRDSFINKWRRQQAINFIDKLESNSQIKELETVYLLVIEYQHFLEVEIKQTLLGSDQIDIYQSFLNRTVRKINNSDDWKVLSYLRSSIFIKIVQLKNGKDASLIIDIGEYISHLLEELTDHQNYGSKMKAIENYQQAIRNIIADLNNFINIDVLLEITSSDTQFDNHIKALLIKVSRKSVKVEEESDELQSIKMELVTQVEHKFLFGFFKTIAKIAGVFGILGEEIEKKVSMSLIFVDSLSQFNDDITTHSIPDGIKKLENVDKVIQELIRDIAVNEDKFYETLEEVNFALMKNERKMRAIREFQTYVTNTIVPLLDEMSEKMKMTVKELKHKSQVALEIKNWGVQKYLSELKWIMSKIATGFEVEERVQRSFDNLSETLTTLIKVYSQIQNYADHLSQVHYIAEVTSPVMNHIEITDLSLTDLMSTTTKRVEKIDAKLKEYKISIVSHDKYLQCGKFNSQYKSLEPFFTWRQTEHKDMIEKLLSGSSVMAYADVTKANYKFAVKFNIAELHFKAIEKSNQTILDDVLQTFQISMTHMGNSYYNYRNDFYVINSPSQTIIYNFQRDQDCSNAPVLLNQVYKKLKNGDLILSPYAMWKLQLIPIENTGDVQSLSKFKNAVDVELAGEGCYLNPKVKYDELDVDSYYQRDTSFPITPGRL